MEIRRFGVGHRRPDGPPDTTGVAGQVIHADARGVVAELAFARRASLRAALQPEHDLVRRHRGRRLGPGRRRGARVAAGEAVLWPAGVDHAAWTELSEMRAIVVELPGADDATARAILEGMERGLTTGEEPGRAAAGTPAREMARPAGAADGRMSWPTGASGAAAAAEGEPL